MSAIRRACVRPALPLSDDASGRTAGPSFELFYESDYLLPHRDAAWALIEERLREAAALADRLKSEGPPEVSARLQPIGPALLGLGHALATCRAAWGGSSHAGEVTVAHRRRDAERLGRMAMSLRASTNWFRPCARRSVSNSRSHYERCWQQAP